jgi:hypothetical protein
MVHKSNGLNKEDWYRSEIALLPSSQVPPDLLLGQLCTDLEQKCLISSSNQNNSSTENGKETSGRGRSYSENSLELQNGADMFRLDPLDMSFDEFDESSFFTTEGEEVSDLGKERTKLDVSNEGIPSANKMAAFRKSFDSATSMVFHHHTGLPLTSSPAPMRRGIKFDFDSGINTPKDIKRALFEAQRTDCELESPKKGGETHGNFCLPLLPPQSASTTSLVASRSPYSMVASNLFPQLKDSQQKSELREPFIQNI